MTHTYNVTGMTCEGCKSSVESSLQSLDLVEQVDVDLAKGQVTITMTSHIALPKLQEALSSKYTITEKNATNVFASTAYVEEADTSSLKQLFPLFLILAYLFITSILLNYDPWQFEGFMLDFMGLFYIVFSFFKFLDLKGFPESFRMYDPLAKRLPVYGWVYPFIELILGLSFLMRFQITIALVATIIVLGITTVGVTKTLLDKKAIQCACLGTALKLPMTKATFIENSIMLVMAVIMLFKTIGL